MDLKLFCTCRILVLFSQLDLLPGTDARLSPPEGMGILDGLEVNVAFGGIWKESLQELSGGQRYTHNYVHM